MVLSDATEIAATRSLDGTVISAKWETEKAERTIGRQIWPHLSRVRHSGADFLNHDILGNREDEVSWRLRQPKHINTFNADISIEVKGG